MREHRRRARIGSAIHVRRTRTHAHIIIFILKRGFTRYAHRDGGLRSGLGLVDGGHDGGEALQVEAQLLLPERLSLEGRAQVAQVHGHLQELGKVEASALLLVELEEEGLHGHLRQLEVGPTESLALSVACRVSCVVCRVSVVVDVSRPSGVRTTWGRSMEPVWRGS